MVKTSVTVTPNCTITLALNEQNIMKQMLHQLGVIGLLEACREALDSLAEEIDDGSESAQASFALDDLDDVIEVAVKYKSSFPREDVQSVPEWG